MNDAPPSLDALRREIDTVDDALHDLMMRRAALVGEIGAVKNTAQAAVFRPSREAALLRRLLARNDANLPPLALVRIWREVIGASTLIQGGLTVAYCPVGDAVTGDRLARGRFGAGAALLPVSTPAQVVMSVTSGEALVGLVPVPRQDDAAPWWPQVYGRIGDAAVQVVAGVPFLLAGEAKEVSALVIAQGEPEPSGDDRSLVVLECDQPFSRDRIRSVLTENGFDPAHSVSYDDPGRPGIQLHLADVAGHVVLDDPRLANVRLALPAAAVGRIGAYAAPVPVTA